MKEQDDKMRESVVAAPVKVADITKNESGGQNEVNEVQINRDKAELDERPTNTKFTEEVKQR